MNKKLLVLAISAALMGSIGMVTETYAAPTNENAIANSCKNNPGNKTWCETEEQATEEDGTVVEEGTTDGEATTDGEVVEGEVTDGEVVDGEVTDGEVVEGEVTEGEVVEGEVTEGEVVDGEVTEGEVVDGEAEVVDGEGEVVDGEAEVVDGETEVVDGEAEVVDGEAEVVDGEAEVVDGEAEVVEVEVETEVVVELTPEDVVEGLAAEGDLDNADAVIDALNQADVTISDLPEDVQNELPITDDPIVLPPETEEVADEEAADEEAADEEAADEEVADEEEEATDEEATDEEAAEEEVADEEATDDEAQPLEPADVDEPTFSEELTEAEAEVIVEQLEVVEEVIVDVDVEGNDITAPVDSIEAIGEVLIPAGEEGGANAEVFGEEMSIQAELGTAEAIVENGETTILTTVTDLEIGEVAPSVEEVVETEATDEAKPISLDVDENGNIVLTLRGLRIGDLVVTVTLRALTDSLEVYQVEQVTMEPEDVFASDDPGEAEEAEQEAADAAAEEAEVEADAETEAAEAEAEVDTETAEAEEVEAEV